MSLASHTRGWWRVILSGAEVPGHVCAGARKAELPLEAQGLCCLGETRVSLALALSWPILHSQAQS